MNHYSNPTDLKITDMRFVDIDGAPKRCTILRIDTNQGISGYGEVRDASSKTYALMLKSRILGENPCNVDKIFRKIKQFGGPSRQGGGVSGIEDASRTSPKPLIPWFVSMRRIVQRLGAPSISTKRISVILRSVGLE